MSQTRSIAFTKMNGLGNDFVVIDARRENARLGAAEVRALAARDHAVTNGCDQLLILHPPRNTGGRKQSLNFPSMRQTLRGFSNGFRGIDRNLTCPKAV